MPTPTHAYTVCINSETGRWDLKRVTDDGETMLKAKAMPADYRGFADLADDMNVAAGWDDRVAVEAFIRRHLRAQGQSK